MALNYSKELDSMVWSFSRIKLYNQCPYAFYLKYIERCKSTDEDFYSGHGSLMHEIFEKLLKNEIDLQEAVDYYIDQVENLRYLISSSIYNNTFDSCLNYLCECDPFVSNGFKIYAENKIEFAIGKYNFIGYIDVLLVNEVTGEIIIIDHKSSTSKIYKKNGEVLKGKESIYEAYKRQLYTYAYAVYVKFGTYPKKLLIHHFKDNGAITRIDFSIEEMNATIDWIISTIESIYDDVKFIENKDWFFCNNLCSYRSVCCYMKEESE